MSNLFFAAEAGEPIEINFLTDAVLPILAIIFLVAVNGVFVAAEFALVGSRRARFAKLAEGGSRGAKWLLRVFDRPAGKDSYIAVAQLGITLASIGLGMYGEPAFAKLIEAPFVGVVSDEILVAAGFAVALSIITFLHVVFGEMIPKALALQSPEGTSLRVNSIMRTFSTLFRPFVALLNAIAFAMMRALRIPEPDKAVSLYSAEELAIVTEESATVGELPKLQSEIIHNIFELEELTAEELMTSRTHIEAISHDASRADVAQRVMGSGISRYPVFGDDLDHVVGLLHVKDFVRVSQSDEPLNLSTLVRQLPTVTRNTNADVLLERFKGERIHAALVVDELGSTIGLVTLDDIISEVIDDPAGENDLPAVHHDDGSTTLDGETTLTELEEDFGFSFEHDDVTTLAGLVLASTGTIPKAGVTVDVQGHDLTVETVENHKITQVRVVRAAPVEVESVAPDEDDHH